MPEPQIGLHVSAAGSLDLAFDRATEVGATTFQLFTRNPNKWQFSPIPDEVVTAFREKRAKTGLRRVVDHMPYLPNLASSEPVIMKASRSALNEEVKRCDSLGIDYLVIHLGSHRGAGTASGVRNISEAINAALVRTRGESTILLENMAGQKNCVGARFEELDMILGKVKRDGRVGVCLDTCHMYAAGFDLGSDEAVSATMAVFDECVGNDRLKVVHLNDSKGALGSNLDRHEIVGKGKIGAKGMKAILRYKGILERPLIMETPFADVAAMKQSLSTVRRFIK
ncbi:MAG TPA: deoxyribonuclease IV [Nitrososphaerales archaeon]|nr:deoxyribonuclease IV [Nitrososphaerales archaeon]